MGYERLKEHYNQKRVRNLELIPVDVRHPSNRAEAAVRALAPRIPPGAKVLELGPGDGRTAESLRRGGVDFGSYTLVELSDVRLEGLRQRLTDPVYRFVEGDAERISDSVDDTYDVVVMIALIEHLVDPMGAMQHVAKILRPGGFAYVDTPNIAKWTRRLRLLVGRFPTTGAINEGLITHRGEPADLLDEGHLHYFTYRQLELMLTQRCGFERTERLGYFCGPRMMPTPLGSLLAQRRPSFFGEIAVAAHVAA